VRLQEDEDNIPDYIKNLPPPTDEKIWASIEDQFNEFNDTILTVKLETKEQAVRQRHGVTTVDKGVYWDDPEASGRVRSWLQIPFDPSRDEEHFLEVWETAKQLAKTLRPKISEQRMDVQFLGEWGAFCRYAGIVEAEYLRDRPNLQHLKGAARQSREQHKRWYAHVFMRLRREGDDRKATDMRVLDHIHELLKQDDFPNPAFPRIWFDEIINESTEDLTRAFQEGAFKLQDIEELSKSPTDDLPSFGFITSDP